MAQQEHIAPPPELIEDWIEIAKPEPWKRPPDPNVLCTLAAQWGADQELDACCDWFQEFYKTESWVKHDLKHFRDARRPKPPSLKEQALEALEAADGADHPVVATVLTADQHALIRRALESLPD
jgi:hypothetical protein